MSLLCRSVSLYWHTVRHLLPIQIFGFARNRVLRCLPAGPAIQEGAEVQEGLPGPVTCFLRKETKMQGTQVSFLNHSIDYPTGILWDDPRPSKLWRYHLHYMEFLWQETVSSDQRREWMLSWVKGNRNPKCEGWEPFPISIRLACWFKVWAEQGVSEKHELLFASAYAQARHLRRCIEYHLQGNHLFENFKTLFWAGCIFKGAEAVAWRKWSADRLMEQLQTQVLPDGGHFERSPMYHSLVLEGCLDLLNIRSVWAHEHPELARLLSDKCVAMLSWLEAMTHPDQEIALFNDSAFHTASAPSLLFAYGQKLGLNWSPPERLTYFEDSGYVVIRDAQHYLAVDVGPIGPDYQPGHGHCDLLSFEWSTDSGRIICDSGLYAYQDQVMRSYVRSTGAHNTVRIDGEEQSEVWKEFRVARRASPLSTKVETLDNGRVSIVASHDGYRRLRGRPIHSRELTYQPGRLLLLDSVTGEGTHDIEAFLHFHPSVFLENISSDEFNLLVGGQIIGHISFQQWPEAQISQGWYCQEFGRREANRVLTFIGRVDLPFVGRVEITLGTWVA